jgi:hypothetical protein
MPGYEYTSQVNSRSIIVVDMRNMLTFDYSHGYIPRNGITTVAQTVIAAARVFNMGAYVHS